nr:hypothetical protein [Tanacetum cinerariifolium]
GNILQFEEGYLVETVVEGNQLGVVPYSIRVSQEGELYAVDSVNSNIVRITPPLSQYSRARLIAGSFQGYTGHVDGKPNDARFDHPKGVTMDDKGNVYVADTSNLAIRKIGEAGVTTIAGGKSNVAGYRDGPSEDAQFSTDFDIIYLRPTCSLLVIDRGNAALRQIALSQEDCDFHDTSVSSTDLILVVSAILIGYVICILQQGYGSSYFTKVDKVENDTKQPIKENSLKTHTVETVKEEQEAGWPSFGQLVMDLSKLAIEGFEKIKMGCSGSTLNKQDRTVKKIRKPKPWKFPRPVTWNQLVQMRDEFWDIAPHHGGKKEIWDAIHAAAEADIELAQAILDSAGVILHKPDMTVCSDERGVNLHT